MGIFDARARRVLATAPVVTSHPRESRGLPEGFEAVAESLLAHGSAVQACTEVGRRMALDGASVEEALAGLRGTWRTVGGADPDFDAITALVGAWSETTLEVVGNISCEDPLTGLGSVAHLRSCLGALYRGQRQDGAHPRDSHALVVVDLPSDGRGPVHGRASMARALRMATLGEGARAVFPGNEVIGRLGATRIAVLGARDARLGVRVRLLRRLVEGMELSGHPPRVWIEGLPGTDLASGRLLDELSRS